MDPKFALSVQLWPRKTKENKQYWGTTSPIGLSKYVKLKALSLLPFPGTIRLLFAIFRLFLIGNRAGSLVKLLKSKFNRSHFTHTIPGQFLVKKIWFQHFPIFAAIDHKGHFRKILTRIFKFGCFSHLLKLNLMLNRLATISNPKNEKGKSSNTLF